MQKSKKQKGPIWKCTDCTRARPLPAAMQTEQVDDQMRDSPDVRVNYFSIDMVRTGQTKSP